MRKLWRVILPLGFLLSLLCVDGSAQRRIDLSAASADVEIVGLSSVKKSGHSLAVGDVNGDSIKDLIIGAPGFDAESKPQEGRVFVIFGSSALPGILDFNAVPADLEIAGRQAHSGLGTAVAAADINGDGIDDIIMGGPGTDGKAGEKAGAVYIVKGGASLPSVMNVLSADVRISGEAAINEFGGAIAAGDINNDSIADLIFGVPFADPPGRPNAGKVVIVYGSSDMPDTLELSETEPDLEVFGPGLNDFMANAVASGDLNNDGRDDLIIGDHKANAAGGVDAGKTFIIFGSDSLEQDFDLATMEPHVTISGGAEQDHFGFAVSTGDFNGDGISDVMVGARRADVGGASNAGKVYIFLSTEAWPAAIDLTTDRADFTILGTAETSRLGFSLASGNVNGDDKADLVMGALFSSPEDRNQSGEGFVFWGLESINGALDFSSDGSDVIILGAAPGHSLGNAVAVGDIDADGRDDVIIAAEDAPPAGRVYLFSGDKITHVETEHANSTIPMSFQVHQNYPNPFNPGTTILLEIPSNAGPFEVAVHNLTGQLVTRLFEGAAPAGNLKLRWDGRDEVGQNMASGVYVYAVKFGDGSAIQRKLILLR
jgi:hypothetical protein